LGVRNSATLAGSSIETDKIFGEGRLELKADTTIWLSSHRKTIYACEVGVTEHSTSVTKIGFSSGSAAIEMTARLFSLPATEDLHAVRCQKLRAEF
jgi:hypothetical protein